MSNKQKIRLEAYIQMNYLDRILVHANTRPVSYTHLDVYKRQVMGS